MSDRRERQAERVGDEVGRLKALHRRGVLPFWKLELLAWLDYEPAKELAEAPGEVRLLDAADLVAPNWRIRTRIFSAYLAGALGWYGRNIYEPNLFSALESGLPRESLEYPLEVLRYVQEQLMAVTWIRSEGAGFFPDADYLISEFLRVVGESPLVGAGTLGSFFRNVAHLVLLARSGAPGSSPTYPYQPLDNAAYHVVVALELEEEGLFDLGESTIENFERTRIEVGREMLGTNEATSQMIAQHGLQRVVARRILDRAGKEFLLSWFLVDRDPWLERTS